MNDKFQHFVECHRTSETVEAAHQIVYDFYRDIQSGLLKSYITSQMSYMILAYYNSNGSECFLLFLSHFFASNYFLGSTFFSFLLFSTEIRFF